MSQDNQNTAAEKESGGYGTPTVEQEMGGGGNPLHAEADTNDPGVEPGVTPIARDADGVGFEDGDAVVPSADAEIDESNSDAEGSDEFSSEPGQDAAGLADGSGNDLPKEKSPKDDDAESFDAG